MMKKGLELPVNMIVIIVIAALVLVVLVSYFLSMSGTSMSDAQANAAFRSGCLKYCKTDVERNYISAYSLSQSDTEFMSACEKLGYGNKEFPNRCLEKCGSFCDMEATPTDISNRHDQVISSLK
jgi:Tfp pilus assembly protein PilE